MTNAIVINNASYMPSLREWNIPLLAIATYLNKNGHQAYYFELNYESEQYLLDFIKNKKIHAVIFSATSPEIFNLHSLIRRIKMNHKVISIIGGPHVELLGNTILHKFPYFDFAGQGDGPLIVKKICDYLDKRINITEIKGIFYKKSKRILHNPGREHSLDIGTFLSLDYNLINKYKRFYGSTFFTFNERGYKYIPLIGTFGCNHTCSFCSIPVCSGFTARRCSADLLYKEFMRLHQIFPDKVIHMQDADFLSDEDRARKFFLKLKKGRKKIRWEFETRIDSIEFDLMRLAHETGCINCYTGVENASSNMLFLMNKRLRNSEISDKLAIVRKNKINPRLYIILNYKEDSILNIARNILFFARNKISFRDIKFFNGVHLYPETSFTKGIMDEYKISDWYDLYTVKDERAMKHIRIRNDLPLFFEKKSLYTLIKNIGNFGVQALKTIKHE
jgi:radical SAM superfamily enzyme YgiQ (UPF0313 family)